MIHLDKWYLDLVDDAGRVAIIYWAQLAFRFGGREPKPPRDGAGRFGQIAHASFRVLEPDGTIEGRSTARPGSGPRIGAEGLLRFDAPALGLFGVWRAERRGSAHELFRRGSRTVTWNCLAPRAAVELAIGGRTLVGRGYAERLVVTMAPWRLPIDELRWGRLVAADTSATWIDWRGPVPCRLLLLDDEAVIERTPSQRRGADARRTTGTSASAGPPPGAPALRTPAQRVQALGEPSFAGVGCTDHLDDRSIRWDRGLIELAPVRTLRDAPLSEGSLATVQLLARLLPRRLRTAQETKWLSRGTLTLRSGSEDAEPTRHLGWAIHELVTFGPATGLRG
ncbi:MAG TPA: hypothetical protein PKC43_01885 [Phycisphaerales bacterium]|nr:hypothetical protein [Phycisphaerales bacterium]HMP36176.1 hypothetical protein [Phycisphaerales bacterium]